MATKSFGRRGIGQTVAAPSSVGVSRTPPRTVTRDHDHTDETVDGGTLLLSSIPIVTVGIIVVLLLIFAIEQRFAFDKSTKGELSVLSLTAFGAASYDLVFASGQIWRPFMAPLLHASFSHFLGNSIALFFIGMRLEPLIGRSWLSAIFVASAIGGICGSLIANPHGVVTVGASGAITGLLAALFAVSFHPRAARHDQRSMRITALRFGIPALGPLMFGATGHTDYHAHLGGAMAGVALALILSAFWDQHRFRPRFSGVAMAASIAGIVASLVATACAIRAFPTYSAVASDLIPARERPDGIRIGELRSAALLARYPRDPSSHVYRAVALLETEKTFAAEMELRSAMALAGTKVQGQAVRNLARSLLAQVIAHEGRRKEARELVRDFCADPAAGPLQKAARTSKLCD